MDEVELETKENPVVQHYNMLSDELVALTQEKFDEINAIASRNGMIISIIRHLSLYEEVCRTKKTPFHMKHTIILQRLYALAKSLDGE